MILKNKKIGVVGLARSGVAVAKYAVRRGAKVTVTDLKSKTELGAWLKLLSDQKKIKYELGNHPLKKLLNSDLLVISPGVPFSLPLIQEAIKKQIPVMSEIEFAARYIRKPMVAITGTNGKTTTTMMIGELLSQAGFKTFVGGNIGNPLTQWLLDSKPYDVAVTEISSFQLELVEKFHPKVSLILNVTPDHLDRHGSMENYWMLKGRIFQNQTSTDVLILNADDEWAVKYASHTKSKVLYFSRSPLSPKQEGMYIQDGNLVLRTKAFGKETYVTSSILLKGQHNLENFMAAILVAKVFKCPKGSIQKVLDSFQPVAHRLEFVRSKGNVEFYNDSKATNIYSVRMSLESFEKPVILIMGGKKSEAPFETLRPLVQSRVKILICLGESKEIISRALGDYSETFVVGTLEEAIFVAYQKSRAGDVILFSPGCKSFDMFKDYEDRGNRFKEMVREI